MLVFLPVFLSRLFPSCDRFDLISSQLIPVELFLPACVCASANGYFSFSSFFFYPAEIKRWGWTDTWTDSNLQTNSLLTWLLACFLALSLLSKLLSPTLFPVLSYFPCSAVTRLANVTSSSSRSSVIFPRPAWADF